MTVREVATELPQSTRLFEKLGIGCMLYLPLITLIFYRFTFVNVTTASLTPPGYSETLNQHKKATVATRLTMCMITSYE